MRDASAPASDRVVSASPAEGVNLFAVGALCRVFRSPFFPYVLQAVVLVAFVAMAAFAWGRFAPEGVPAKLYAQTNLVNLVLWGLWWPAMVWVTVFLGRVWCMICPLELVANGAERLGRAAGLRQRALGPWLRGGFLMLALFVAIQALVPGIQIHRVPAYSSVFLWAMLGAALVVGFLYRDRAFCRGFCPVGLLLSAYGRGGMLAVRPASQAACGQCLGHDCTQPPARDRLDARSCPSLLNPARLDRSNDCLVCGQCVKVCPPGNMGLYLRRPFSSADAREPLASWAVTLFVVFVSGFVVSELCSEWPAAKAAYQWAPERVTAWLGLAGYGGWVEAVWTLAVVPAALWLALGGLAVATGAARGLPDALRRLALPLAVLVAAGHMCKGLAKFAMWVGYLPLALRDPAGAQTALAVHAKSLAVPPRIMSMPAVSVTAVLLVVLGAWLAYREFRLAGAERPRRFLAPIALLTAFFGFLVVGWGWAA